MGGYFSSIKVDEANVTNATNDAEHDDVLVLTEKKVDPVELKNDESGLIALDDDKDKDIDKEKCDEFASRTTENDVVYTKKNIKKKKNKKKKAKFLQ
jgi:hypothetical protein